MKFIMTSCPRCNREQLPARSYHCACGLDTWHYDNIYALTLNMNIDVRFYIKQNKTIIRMRSKFNSIHHYNPTSIMEIPKLMWDINISKVEQLHLLK